MNNIYTSSKLNMLGESVQGYDDLSQSIGVILTTQKGSVPHIPLFGVDHFKYLDKPLETIKGAYIADIVNALTMWERRIEVVNVRMEQEDTAAVVTVEWRPNGENVLFTFEVPLGGF